MRSNPSEHGEAGTHSREAAGGWRKAPTAGYPRAGVVEGATRAPIIEEK